MIRLRGIPLGDDASVELARRLRDRAGAAMGIAEDRASPHGRGRAHRHQPTEARAFLPVADQWLSEAEVPEGLREARAGIVEMLSVL